MKNRFAVLFAAITLAASVALAAPPDGTWRAGSTGQGAPQTLVLQASGENLTGTADGVSIVNGKTQGSAIWFSVVRGGVTFNYKGTIAGTSLDLHETHADGTQHRALSYTHS